MFLGPSSDATRKAGSDTRSVEIAPNVSCGLKRARNCASAVKWRADVSTEPTIKDFEAAIAELETIVKKLEEGDLALEKSLELYERGVQLSRFCHSRLEEAERRIEIVNERGELKSAPASLNLPDDEEE
jgi:exodeoxyribonuclease VII small subunit